MKCPKCHANDYEILFFEQDESFNSPLDLEAVLAIELRTDWTHAKTSADLINTFITCRRCGSFFIKDATESTREAYTRHTEAVQHDLEDADYFLSAIP